MNLYSIVLGIGMGAVSLGASALQVTSLSPQGEVAQVRQVVAKFDQDAVRFGDGQAPAPLAVQCSDAQASQGSGRWTSAREWVFDFARALLNHDVVFGLGPAGTGKTYLAVAAAVDAMEKHQVERIVLVRPAVEAGEKLGFLPGDLAQKVDPYLRPLYDALYDLMGFDRVTKLLEKGLIEIAPLAYMRGRTLNGAYVILDEAQNTTPEQMKMFLTRIGFGAKAVITGDVTQIDLPRHIKSGLKDAREKLADIDGIYFHVFTSEDVVRHPLVQKIVDAYDAADADTSA